jgi:hypothetical protein
MLRNVNETRPMTSSTATPRNFYPSGQFIPAAVNSAMTRQGDNYLRGARAAGSTIDQEGLINNYAVEPKMSYAAEDSDTQKFRLGIIFAAVTWMPIAIAVLVS